MRKSQWYLIGIFLMVMSFWFMRMDINDCDSFIKDEGPFKYSLFNLATCSRDESFDPFIWLLFPLGWIFIICGWLESRAEKRAKR